MHMSRNGAICEVADDLHFANGLTRSHDGHRLLVNESEAYRVISFKIESDGSLSDRRLFLRMHELGEAANAYPDGIKLGPDGCYYIGLYSAGRIVVVNAEGKLLRVIEVPSAAAPNVAFSEDGNTLFVMAVDEKTKRVYRRTDSATLLGLLPELRRLAKAAQKERERVLADPATDVDTTDGRYATDLAAYAAAALERDGWIRDELKRRELMPLWPGEDEHLFDDA